MKIVEWIMLMQKFAYQKTIKVIEVRERSNVTSIKFYSVKYRWVYLLDNFLPRAKKYGGIFKNIGSRMEHSIKQCAHCTNVAACVEHCTAHN